MFTGHGCRDRKCDTTVGPMMSAKEHIHMLEQMWGANR
uniref:Transposase n=1 Tax=Ascaris lumbricoides TaxID=6252 RepID=A0A0M3IWR8_ASCLU